MVANLNEGSVVFVDGKKYTIRKDESGSPFFEPVVWKTYDTVGRIFVSDIDENNVIVKSEYVEKVMSKNVFENLVLPTFAIFENHQSTDKRSDDSVECSECGAEISS